MGVIERVAKSWKNAPYAFVGALACLSASLLSCPQVGLKSVSRAGLQIVPAIPSPGPIMVSIEDDREFQEDELKPCGLPSVWLISPPSLALSHITPPQSICFLSVLTPAQRPLRC
jgi:hypothetical protein